MDEEKEPVATLYWEQRGWHVLDVAHIHLLYTSHDVTILDTYKHHLPLDRRKKVYVMLKGKNLHLIKGY